MSDGGLYASRLVWIFFFLALYWAFCLFWGVRSARASAKASAFFVAGRDLPLWVFIMGATATSFAGWIFVGQPALMLRDGLQAGYVAFAAVVLPMMGAVLLKRQWMLGKRFGFVTPGEMLAAYLRSDAVRVFTAVVALLFAVPFLGLLLGAAGQLASVVTGGLLTRDMGMVTLAAMLLICVTLGGLRAVAYAGTLQTILIVAGTIILGLAALHLASGFEGLNAGLARIAETPQGPWGTTRGYGGGDYNALFATPGVVQWTDGLGRETPAGGPWTGLMVMTFLLALAGIQASPAFSLLAFASRDPRAFAPQQVWASAGAFGLLLLVFVTLQGLAGLLLGADGALADAGFAPARVLPPLDGGREGTLTAWLIGTVGHASPWLLGVLTVCALVALTAGAGAHMVAAGAILARDIHKRFFDPAADDRVQKRFARVSILILTILALVMAAWFEEAMVALGGLALSMAVQLVPALLAVLWIPWLTRRGVVAGLAAGSVVAVLTDAVGQAATGGALPWGQWPWTIHAAAWGLVANLVVCLLGSAMTQDAGEAAHRGAFHAFLRENARLPAGKRRLVALAWVLAIAWVFFGVGPGIVLGNYIFGAPDAGYAGWDFAMPSIWAWQLLWWGLGVLLVWFLAYKMDMSTQPLRDIVPLTDDATVTPDGAGPRSR